MNYLVITPMPNEQYLVQLMFDNQFQALKKAGVVGADSTVFSTSMDHAQVAQAGIIGMHTMNEIISFVKDNDEVMTHVEGPPIGDDGGDA